MIRIIKLSPAYVDRKALIHIPSHTWLPGADGLISGIAREPDVRCGSMGKALVIAYGVLGVDRALSTLHACGFTVTECAECIEVEPHLARVALANEKEREKRANGVPPVALGKR